MRLHALIASAALGLVAGCDRAAPPAAPGPGAAAPAGTGTASDPAASPPGPAVPDLPGLVFGQPVADASGWHRDQVQASDECLTYTSPAMPKAYAMVVAGRLERVTFGRGSGFRLPGGIAPGSPVAAVRQAYPDFLAEPHKYEAAPAGYLTSPGLAADAVGLRFEIDATGEVSRIHIGLPSSLSLVEGCA